MYKNITNLFEYWTDISLYDTSNFTMKLRYIPCIELKEKPLEYKQIFTDFHETRDIVDSSKHRGRL